MSHQQHVPHVPEKVLRQLWHHQQFDTAHLRTTDGRTIEIIFPGVHNPDGGPDFLDARIRIGGTLYCGSVELHRTYKAWLQHAHHLDSKYNRVVLHVVCSGDHSGGPQLTKSKRTLPVLVLGAHLTPAVAQDAPALADGQAERSPEIRCFGRNDAAEPQVICRWLKKLALERIEVKVRRFDERLRELAEELRRSIHEPGSRYHEVSFGLNPEELPPPGRGYLPEDLSRAELWEQLLYEGLMEALGYSKNQQSFLKLARSATLRILRNGRVSSSRRAPEDSAEAPLLAESILFSVAGLLPPRGAKLDRPSAKRIRRLRSLWRTVRRDYHNEFLTAADWQFFRLRPENFPTVRLAGAARLADEIMAGRLFKSIIHIAKTGEPGIGKTPHAIIGLFMVSADDFWSIHYRFGEPAGTPLKHLIGKSRARDIALNVAIPVSLLYARTFKDKDVRHGTLAIFEDFPRLSDNVVTRCVRAQLLKEKLSLDNAMLQQGAIHLFRSYCSEDRCGECAIGRSVFT